MNDIRLISRPADSHTHTEAWKSFNKTYAKEQQTLQMWAFFLAGWQAKADLMRERRVRGV